MASEVHRYKVGDIEVAVVPDGFRMVPLDNYIMNASKEEINAALAAAGLTQGGTVGFVDERRVGVPGTVGRVWGRRGVPVRPRVQISSPWRYLVLVVAVPAGRRWWNGNETMAADALMALVRGMQATTASAAVVGEGAPSHQDGRLPRIGVPLIARPP